MSVVDRPVGPGRVAPERLLARTRPKRILATRSTSGTTDRAARTAVRILLGRISRDGLTVVDHTEPSGPTRVTFGPADSDLTATVHIHDPRAWRALIVEGSIGLGRGYLEGWWDSDDPVAVVRVIIRNLAGLDDIRNRIHRVTGWATDPVRARLPRSTRARNRDQIATHYDLGNDFFALFLDETMTYSSGVFTPTARSMADASRAKYDLLLNKLSIAAEHEVLEIGTGWGGFALRAAERTSCSVTTTTVSDEQLAEARHRVAAAGRDGQIEVLGEDWRDLEGRFDRIVSIEMIEAVDWRDYDQFFSTIERCLAPDGMVAIQAICVPDRRWARTKNTEDFIRRFVFPGGYLPSIGAITESVSRSTRLQITDVADLSVHYAETLRRWRARFDSHLDEIEALGLDDRFRRLWRFYLAYCEAGFAERHCTVNQIVLVGPEWRAELPMPSAHRVSRPDRDRRRR